MEIIRIFRLIYFFLCFHLHVFATKINTSWSCPTLCVCTEISVDCSNASLTLLNFGIPSDVKTLNFSGNKLLDFRPVQFDGGGFYNTEVLDLSRNVHIDLDSFSLLQFPALKSLYLEYCDLTMESLNFIIAASSSANNLRFFYLKRNKVENLIDDFATVLHNLEYLDVSHNVLTAFPSTPLLGRSSTSSLKHLFLNNNQMEHLHINCFQNLTALVTLNLSRNKFRQFPKDVFSTLKNLHNLDLAGNRLRRIPGLCFNGLQNLRTLRLERNGLNSLSDGAFYDAPRLRNLHLSHNKLTSIDRGWLYGLQSLEKLYINSNLLTHIDSGSWQFCLKLSHLDLSRNRLKTLRGKTFWQLSSLKDLLLARNQISQIYENAFASLSGLKLLDLSYNSLADVIVSGQPIFRDLINLQTLKLNENKLKFLPNGPFDGLNELVRLELSGNDLVVISDGAIPSSPVFETLVVTTDTLICDCRTSWLVDLLSRNLALNVNGYLKCRLPNELNGLELFELNSSLSCFDNEALKFVKQPQNFPILRGRPFKFECQVSCRNCLPTFIWKKNGELLYSDESENEFEIVREQLDDENWKSELNMKSVDESDSGMYLCHVTSSASTILSEKAHLVVHIPPSFVKQPNNVTVPLMGTARLECSATGSPSPMISWKKDGGDNFPAASERRMHVMPTDDVFFIVNVKAQDAGVYTCFARSTAGTIGAEAVLTVNDVDQSSLDSVIVKSVNRGETAVFECNIALGSANSNSEVTWLHNDKVVQSDSSRRHLATNGKVLIILQTRNEDQGVYTCKMGDLVQTARLTVIGANEENASKNVEDPKLPKIARQNPDDSSVVLSSASGGSFDPNSTAGIVIIVVVTCVVLTSLAWVLVIWRSRRTASVVLALRQRSSTSFQAVANVRV